MSRALLVPLLLVFVVRGAVATPPQEPYAFGASFDEPPRVNETVTLTVRIEARAALDASLRLDAPPWVRVEEPREWQARIAAGASEEHTWRVSATRAGFWRASLSVDAARASAYGAPVDPARAWQPMGACCLYALSEAADARFAARPDGAIPPAEANVTYSFEPLDEETVAFVVHVDPVRGWAPGEEISVQFFGGEMLPQRAPADGPRAFRSTLPLAPGASAVVTASTGAWVVFEDGNEDAADIVQGLSIACANLQVTRDADGVRETGRWGCEAQSGRPRGIPAPPLATLVALLLGVALARGRHPAP